MFFAEAARQGEPPFPVGQAPGRLSTAQLGRCGAAGDGSGQGAAGLGPAARRPRRCWSPRTGRNGSSPISPSWRRAASPCRPTPPIPSRITATCWPIAARSASSSRPRRWRSACCRRPARSPGVAKAILDRAARGRPRLACRAALLAFRAASWARAAPGDVAGLDRGDRARRHRLPDLHLGHGRHAQGRDDDATATSSPIAPPPMCC